MTLTLPIYLGYDFQSIGSVTVDYEYVEGENALTLIRAFERAQGITGAAIAESQAKP